MNSQINREIPLRGAIAAFAVAAVASCLPGLSAGASAAGPARAGAVETEFASGSVSVRRSPLRITLRSRSGRTMLSSLARRSQSGGVEYSGIGFTVGPVPELEPPSFDQPPAAEPGAGESFVAKRLV